MISRLPASRIRQHLGQSRQRTRDGRRITGLRRTGQHWHHHSAERHHRLRLARARRERHHDYPYRCQLLLRHDDHAGTLQLGSSGALGSGAVTVDGGTLDINSISATVAGLTLASGSVIGTTGVLKSNSTYEVESGAISADLGGSVGLSVPTGGPAGSVTLSGANTYTGGILVGQGTLTLASNGAAGLASLIQVA